MTPLSDPAARATSAHLDWPSSLKQVVPDFRWHLFQPANSFTSSLLVIASIPVTLSLTQCFLRVVTAVRGSPATTSNITSYLYIYYSSWGAWIVVDFEMSIFLDWKWTGLCREIDPGEGAILPTTKWNNQARGQQIMALPTVDLSSATPPLGNIKARKPTFLKYILGCWLWCLISFLSVFIFYCWVLVFTVFVFSVINYGTPCLCTLDKLPH